MSESKQDNNKNIRNTSDVIIEPKEDEEGEENEEGEEREESECTETSSVA